MPPDASHKRYNGFEGPHSNMQFSTWVLLPGLMFQFLFFVTPILPLAASVICTLLFLMCCIAATLFGYIATALDPMDPSLTHDKPKLKEPLSSVFWQFILKRQQKQEQHPSHSPGVAAAATAMKNGHGSDQEADQAVHNIIDGPMSPKQASETKYCWVCEHDVHTESMHCRYCNKCVAHFDHHCQWLNTCVGSRNYEYFYKTLWSIFMLLLIHAVLLLSTSIDILAGGTTRARANDWFQADLFIVVVCINLLFFLLDAAAFTLILQLLLFHLKLRRMGLTTYKYILQDSAEKRILKQAADDRQSKRVVAMGQAKRNHQTVLYYRLALGRYAERIPCCRHLYCDPLPRENSAKKDRDDVNNIQINTNTSAVEIELSHHSERYPKTYDEEMKIEETSFPVTEILPGVSVEEGNDHGTPEAKSLMFPKVANGKRSIERDEEAP